MKTRDRIVVRISVVLMLLSLFLVMSQAQARALPLTDGKNAQDGDLQLSVTLPWQGRVRMPGWAEFQITLRNEGSDWHGDLEINDKDLLIDYHKAISLPAHSNKHYRIPVFIRDSLEMQVTLQDQEGNQTSTKQVFQFVTQDQRVCVFANPLGHTPGELQGCDILQNLTATSMLPEIPLAWDTLDLLIINGNLSTELTSAQREALLAWVSAGGHLIISGGTALAQALSGLPPQLQIAAPGSIQILEQLKLQNTVLTNVAVTTLSPIGDVTTLVQTPDMILATRDEIGQGIVDVVGWDLIHSKDQEWLENLWKDERVPAVQLPHANEVSPGLPKPSYHNLIRFPATAMPKLWRWLLIFPAYALLMGPVTWYIVRRAHRPILAWALLPLWIVLTLVGVALTLKGAFSQAFPVVNEIALINAPGSNLPSRVIQGSAIYAPGSRKLVWKSQANYRYLTGIHRFDNWSFEGTPYAVDIVNLVGHNQAHTTPPLGVLTWGIEGIIQAPELESALSIQRVNHDTLVTGTLKSGIALHDIRFLFGNPPSALHLAKTIPPNTEISIQAPLSATGGASIGMPQLCIYDIHDPGPPILPLKRSSGQNLLPSNNCYIVGITDGVPFPIEDLGKHHFGTSCLFYAIPCPAGHQDSTVIQIQSITKPAYDGESSKSW